MFSFSSKTKKQHPPEHIINLTPTLTPTTADDYEFIRCLLSYQKTEGCSGVLYSPIAIDYQCEQLTSDQIPDIYQDKIREYMNPVDDFLSKSIENYKFCFARIPDTCKYDVDNFQLIEGSVLQKLINISNF